MSVVLVNAFVVPVNQDSAFVENWQRTATTFADAPGFLDTRLHRSLEPSARFRFVNIAHWADAETWKQAMTSAPPQETKLSEVQANAALYSPVAGGSLDRPDVSVEAELRQLESNLAEAYRANDVGFLDKLLADDYLVTDAPGTTSDKAKVLNDHRSKKLKVTAFHFDEMQVRPVAAECAVVLGRYTWTATYLDRPISGSFRYLRVYSRSAQGWQLRAGEVTPILVPAGK